MVDSREVLVTPQKNRPPVKQTSMLNYVWSNFGQYQIYSNILVSSPNQKCFRVTAAKYEWCLTDLRQLGSHKELTLYLSIVSYSRANLGRTWAKLNGTLSQRMLIINRHLYIPSLPSYILISDKSGGTAHPSRWRRTSTGSHSRSGTPRAPESQRAWPSGAPSHPSALCGPSGHTHRSPRRRPASGSPAPAASTQERHYCT